MTDAATAPAPAPALGPREKLIADLKVVIADAEELLKLSAGQAGQKASELREQMQQRLQAARANLAHLQNMALDRALDAGQVADGYVHSRPWQAIGVAAGVGLAIGLLIGSRR
jgi:ElaB/YqjD/DUF883 family membrane-anchored ribosome-binding protein